MHKTLIGIDPGLRDTGIMWLVYNPDTWQFCAGGKLIRNTTGNVWDTILAVREFLDNKLLHAVDRKFAHVFIEDYIPRSHYGTDQSMLYLVQQLSSVTRNFAATTRVNNTGSKQTLRPALIKLLGLTPKQTSNHQDLEAAARTLLWGALKVPALNAELADIVRHELEGEEP